MDCLSLEQVEQQQQQQQQQQQSVKRGDTGEQSESPTAPSKVSTTTTATAATAAAQGLQQQFDRLHFVPELALNIGQQLSSPSSSSSSPTAAAAAAASESLTAACERTRACEQNGDVAACGRSGGRDHLSTLLVRLVLDHVLREHQLPQHTTQTESQSVQNTRRPSGRISLLLDSV